jgi:TolB protein
LLSLSMPARASNVRRAAHQVADQIYEKILGVRGAFDTRIAYVTATGLGQGIEYRLMVADSDGFNPQTLVRSREPLLSPAWSPDGKRIAYVSFQKGSSAVYIVELATGVGATDPVSSAKGINGAPAFSPDGTKLALTLSKSGNPEIYVMDIASRSLKQITNHFGIDTEAVWMPDGQSLLFTSDRGGKPQIYQVAASGGEAKRVSFTGEYNARATVSFDGKKIAMAQGAGNVYRIAVLDRSFGGSGRWQTISPGNLDESPSFAPNASMILYATKQGRRGVLYAVSADGRVRQRLVLSDGDVREPAWSPYR